MVEVGICRQRLAGWEEVMLAQLQEGQAGPVRAGWRHEAGQGAKGSDVRAELSSSLCFSLCSFSSPLLPLWGFSAGT